MSEQQISKLPFTSEDPAEQQLWAALGDLPREAPTAHMRRDFYRQVERANSRGLAARIRDWSGIDGKAGLITATACLLVGVLVGLTLNKTASVEATRLQALEQNVAVLNRELILDRLQDASASKRLRGVIDAGNVAQDDAEITRALLLRAAEDRVSSVRSAAIDVLGPMLNSAAAGDELMELLQNAESPIVQLALVDLVLRYGSHEQLDQIQLLAAEGRLHPALIRHVDKSLGRQKI